jgi:hypothetical protein
MGEDTMGSRLTTRNRVRSEFRPARRGLQALVVAVAALTWLAAAPTPASAHGPVAPVATGYVARVRTAPRGLYPEVIDGYVRMWMRVAPHERVVVLDYRGAPFVRFGASGVQINANSEMYYLDQTPYPLAVPDGLTRTTPPRWVSAGSGHAYEWHDGRLQALASIALPTGVSFAGRWTIPVLVNGRRTAITGGLWRVGAPSIVWFWPLVVFLLCSLAAWRVRSPELDARVARVLGIAALIALLIACAGRELHGRPGVSPFQYIELALIALFAVSKLRAILLRRAGFFSYLLTAVVAIWQGLDLLPTLTNGYVLVDLPGFVARVVTVSCLGCAIGLALLGPRLADLDELAERTRRSRPKHRESAPSQAGGVR